MLKTVPLILLVHFLFACTNVGIWLPQATDNIAVIGLHYVNDTAQFPIGDALVSVGGSWDDLSSSFLIRVENQGLGPLRFHEERSRLIIGPDQFREQGNYSVDRFYRKRQKGPINRQYERNPVPQLESGESAEFIIVFELGGKAGLEAALELAFECDGQRQFKVHIPFRARAGYPRRVR